MQKRGISTVVATVLIILITVAAVSILWVAVIPMIKNSNLQPSTASLSIDTTEGFTAYDLQKDLLTVQVKRGADDSVISGIQFVFTKNGVSETDLRNNVPGSNQAVTYNFNMSGFGKPDSIGIAPIDVNNNIGEVVSSITFILAGDLSAVSGDFPAVGKGCSYSAWEGGACGDGSNGCSAGQRVQSRTVTNGTGCNSLTQCVVDSSCNAVVPITSYVIDSCQQISHSGTYTLNKSINLADGSCLNITVNNVILDGNGFTINGNLSGSYCMHNGGACLGINAVDNNTNITIENLNVNNFNGNDLNLVGVSNSLVKNVTLSGEEGVGAYVYLSSNNTFVDISTANQWFGILLDSGSNDNIFTNINASSDYYGITSYSNNNIFTNINAGSSLSYGGGRDSGDGGIGITLYSDNNTLTNINASNSYYDGIEIFGSYNTFTNIITNSNGQDGIYLSYSNSNNTFTNINANSNTNGNGLDLSASLSNTFTNINANSNLIGVHLDSGSNDNIFTNINASSNGDNGIELLSGSNNNVLTNINANSNIQMGISIELHSSNNTLTGTSTNSNHYDGIYLGYNSNNTLTSINSNSNGQFGIYLVSSSNNQLTNLNVSRSGGGGIGIDSSSNNTVKNSQFSSNYGGGIELGSSSGSNLMNNNVCLNPGDDFHCSGSGTNIFTQNKCSGVSGTCSGLTCSPC